MEPLILFHTHTLSLSLFLCLLTFVEQEPVNLAALAIKFQLVVHFDAKVSEWNAPRSSKITCHRRYPKAHLTLVSTVATCLFTVSFRASQENFLSRLWACLPPSLCNGRILLLFLAIANADLQTPCHAMQYYKYMPPSHSSGFSPLVSSLHTGILL